MPLQKKMMLHKGANIMPQNAIILDYDWLSLPKGEFRLLVMIADVGSNLGCASAICRYFRPQTRNPQSDTRNRVVNDLELLVKKGFITLTKRGRRYKATFKKPIEEENKITIEREYLHKIMKREYDVSVAWEQVLKCYLWLQCETTPLTIFTNQEIAEALKISPSTIVSAKRPLKKEYGAVAIDKLTKKNNKNEYKTLGQVAYLSKWWKNE